MRVKQLFFLLALTLFISNPLFAQFFKDNVWWYEQFSYINGGTYYPAKVIIDKDSIVGGQNCKSIIGLGDRRFCYEDSSKIFIWDQNQFVKLYDFTLLKGDTFLTLLNLKVTIDSVFYVNVNGNAVLTQLFSASSIVAEFGGIVMYSIGNIFSFLPFLDNSNLPADLRCYEDSVIGLYRTNRFLNYGCEQVISGIDKEFEQKCINWDSKSIVIESGCNIKKVIIYDILGRNVYERQKYPNSQLIIDKEELPSGVLIMHYQQTKKSIETYKSKIFNY